MSYVGKIVDTDGSTGLVGSTLYGTCATAADTVAKVGTLADFDTLIEGVTVHIKFTYSNTATDPTLNINGTGAKRIYKNGTTSVGKTVATSWAAGSVVSLTYDGTAWQMNDHTDNTNTTYSAGTGLTLSSQTFNHSNSVTAGTAKGDDSKTLTFGGTFTIPTVTYDAQGHITGKGTTTMTMPANPDTDAKVTDTVGTANTYYPAGLTATTTTTGGQVFDTALKFIGTTGTTSAVGKAQLVLGNSTASGTANNKQGSIVVYGSTAYAHTIQGAPTAARTLTLPDKTGTLAVTGDIPTVNNKTLTLKGGGTAVTTFTANSSSDKSLDIVAGSNVSVTADATNSKITIASSHPTITKSTDTTSTASPAHGGTFTTVDSVTRDSNGHVTKINTKTITLPADSNTDTKVTQSATGTANFRPLLSGYTDISGTPVGLDVTVTGQAYVSTKFFVKPSTGEMFIGDSTANQLHLLGGNYGFIIRNDGSDTWFMLTDPNTDSDTTKRYGTYNSLRPFRISNSTGNVFTATTLSAQSANFGEAFIVERTGSTNHAAVTFKNSNGILGYLSMNTVNGNLVHYKTDKSTNYVVLDTGNSSFTQSLTSGTKIGTIKIGGTSTDLYCQTNTNTTYSAGTGLSLSGTTFNHSNSVTARTNYNAPHVKYDAQGHITASSYWVHTATGTNNKAGWIKIATMKHTTTYDNTPIMLTISQRGDTITYRLHIQFSNSNTTDPPLGKFIISSDEAWQSITPRAYIIKSDTSTWDLYIQKKDNYEALVVTRFDVGKYFTDHITWTWTDVQIDTDPTGGTEATKKVYSTTDHTHNYAGSSSAGGAATSANKLNTNDGTANRPVYFSGGVPVQCDAPLSGSFFKGVPSIGTNGVMEIGKYIDFHTTNASTADYDYRIDTTTTAMTLHATGSFNTLTIKSPGSTQLSFQTTSSGKAYTASGITCYPLGTTGMTALFNFGGNVVIGGGEAAKTLYDNDYDTIKTVERETLYLASDSEEIHFITGAQTYAGRKVLKIIGDAITASGLTLTNSGYGPLKIVRSDPYYAGIKFYNNTSTYLGSIAINAANDRFVRFKTDESTSYEIIDRSVVSSTPSAKVDTNWDTTADRTTVVTKGWMSYWNGAYNGSTSNLTYCNRGAFGTIVTKSATDYSKVESSTNGKIKIDGTDTTVYTHPSHTSKTSGLYKITVDASGHVSATASVAKEDIPALDYVPNTNAGVSDAINLLSTGSSTPSLTDYYVAQYVNGGTTTTSYHRRPISALWNAFKGLITLATTGSGNAVTDVSIANDGDHNRKITVTKGSTFSLSTHTHNYAGSSSAGGPATNVAIARVTKDSKVFPGANKVVFEEYTNGTTYNLPSNHFYHIMSAQGHDTKYGTQLALGMTTTAAYYRSCNNQTWSAWKSIINTDTYDRNRYNASIKAGSSALVAANIIVGKDGVYKHLKSGGAFDITYPILYLAGAVDANGTTTNTYDIIHFTITTTQSITLAAYRPVYIKGTLNGTVFTPVNTTPLIQTIPTSGTTYDYIYLGQATSSTTVYLQERHPIYSYRNGRVQEITPCASMAATSDGFVAPMIKKLYDDPTTSTNYITISDINIDDYEFFIICVTDNPRTSWVSAATQWIPAREGNHHFMISNGAAPNQSGGYIHCTDGSVFISKTGTNNKNLQFTLCRPAEAISTIGSSVTTDNFPNTRIMRVYGVKAF